MGKNQKIYYLIVFHNFDSKCPTVECKDEQKPLLDPMASKLDQSYDTQNRCAVCNKQFKSPSKLYLHLLIHTGEKPFKCDICEIGFRQNAHLREHNRKHHPDLPVKPKNKKYKTSFERKSRQKIQYQNY